MQIIARQLVEIILCILDIKSATSTICGAMIKSKPINNLFVRLIFLLISKKIKKKNNIAIRMYETLNGIHYPLI